GGAPAGGGGQPGGRVAGEPRGVEQAGEAANPPDPLGSGRPRDRVPNQGHRAIPRLDAYPGAPVVQRIRGRPGGPSPWASRAHRRAPVAAAPSSTCLPRSASATGTGYSPSKQARHSRSAGTVVAPIEAASERNQSQSAPQNPR